MATGTDLLNFLKNHSEEALSVPIYLHIGQEIRPLSKIKYKVVSFDGNQSILILSDEHCNL